MHGRTCVITGANAGIGFEAARQLAVLGATVLLVCRDRTKGEAAMQEINRSASASGSGGSSELFIADLSAQQQIRTVAADILASHPRIDVLINNAGLALKQREVTIDGIERTFAVNFLAYFMLAHLLMPGLRAADHARIVNVASDAHRAGRLDFQNMQGERQYRNYRMYAESKLQDVMFTYALARRLAGSGITVNTLHPGVVATKIWRQIPILRVLSKWFMTSPANGARTTVYLAASPDVQAVSGAYFDKCKAVRSSTISNDRDLQERLWKVAVDLTGLGGAST
jgi:NAD(P)-dependent dehydrogenase (short-subunit alcohol dehydrogenase family)